MKKFILLFSLLPLMSYSQYTAIPDQNFEQALIDLGYDNVIDGQVLTANINSISYLNVGFMNISNLTGIEDFTSLTYLDCYGNQITNLDLSYNVALTYLECWYNQLTNLDLSQNIDLTFLACNNNQLTNLDLSQNTALTNLNCSTNPLESIDLSQNTALTDLSCVAIQITSLDLSHNTDLELLDCYSNQLTSLDLSQSSALNFLICDDNNLMCLNIQNGNNTNFLYLSAENNPNLTCVEVDDLAWLAQNMINFDSGVTFDTNCNYSSGSGCNSTTIKEQTNSISLYPNPTNNLITLAIEGYNGSVNVEVYDLTGKLLQSTTNTTISMGEYAKGIYVFKVAYGDRVEKLKVVKE